MYKYGSYGPVQNSQQKRGKAKQVVYNSHPDQLRPFHRWAPILYPSVVARGAVVSVPTILEIDFPVEQVQ